MVVNFKWVPKITQRIGSESFHFPHLISYDVSEFLGKHLLSKQDPQNPELNYRLGMELLETGSCTLAAEEAQYLKDVISSINAEELPAVDALFKGQLINAINTAI